MDNPLKDQASALAPKLAAPQHKPRPLPLFLEMLRRETAQEPERMARALRGLRLYQEAPRPPPLPPAPARAVAFGATLRDYGGEGRPVLFVPSLINPPNILDLSAEKSLLRWLAECGHHVLLLDWGQNVEARKRLSVSGHVEDIAMPFIAALPEPPALVGYCLGGTMALAMAAVTQVRSVATIAAPWRFAAYGDARDMLQLLWAQARPAVDATGLLPMELLQSAFWSLDPGRTVAKFERLAIDPSVLEDFVTLEDWANDGPPLPQAAARQLFEDFFEGDAPGAGRWQIGGAAIDPAQLAVPLLNIISTTDRIVPRESAIRPGERLELAQGHVGMVVGSRSEPDLWEPLDAWLKR